MRDDELDFESIQRIFAKRDAEKQTKKEEIPTYELVGAKKPVQYKKTEMRSEPKYDNMRAKNIKITPKGRKHAQNNNLKLIVGVALAVVIGVASYNALKPAEVPEQPNSAIIYMDETYSQNEQDVLTLQECDFSNMTVILRESTSNTAGVVSVANRELTEMGADTRTISSDDDMIGLISNIKKEDSDREIIVINLDGASNKGSDDAVIMTNYSNSAKSADVLAMGIFNANEDIYGVSSDLRCGKKDLYSGKRTKTSVEVMLSDAGYDDIACLTIAANTNCLQNETNNLATSIAEGVVRFASLPEEERYADIIRRVEFGDTISGYAAENDVSESYIKDVNRETLSYYNGNLQYDTAMIVTSVPKVLTSKVTVSNPTVTTNPNDITTSVSYYEVKPNDTISEIAEKLNVSSGDLVIPSGDANKIKVGDKIGYEVTEGPILISKTNSFSK